jgi:hypothetical protein
MDRIPEPLLNPGELWTDRILAELPELGEPWRNLVRHLLTAKSGRPTRRWDAEASAFVEAYSDPPGCSHCSRRKRKPYACWVRSSSARR